MNHSEPLGECVWAQDALIEAREDRLPLPALERLRGHLAACQSCRMSATLEERLRTLIQEPSSADTWSVGASPRLAESVLRQVRRRQSVVRISFAAAAACIVLAMGLAIWGLHTRGGDQRMARIPPPPLSHEKVEQASLRLWSERPDMDLPESLAEALHPPALGLDVLGRQQDAIVMALTRFSEEPRK